RFGNLYGGRDEQHVVLIDGGFAETGRELVEHVTRFYETDKVDLVISTHPDGDHINGLTTVVMELNVQRLWMHTPWDHEEAHEGLFEAEGRVSPSIASGLTKAVESAENLATVAASKNIPIEEPFGPATAFDDQLWIL